MKRVVLGGFLAGAFLIATCITLATPIAAGNATGGQAVNQNQGEQTKIWLIADKNHLFDPANTKATTVVNDVGTIFTIVKQKVKPNGKRMYLIISPNADVRIIGDRNRDLDAGNLTVTLQTGTMMNTPPVDPVPVTYVDDTP